MEFITSIFDVEDNYSLTIDANTIDMTETLSQFLTGLLQSET
jgi:hypothetical protein